jgi:formate hydrogenlyase subunit 6/NADH:ubiquinone oxidoreductase subunit I
MTEHPSQTAPGHSVNSPAHILLKDRFVDLLDALHHDGYEVVGPTIDQAAIVYQPIQHTNDLPIGWTDRQDAGIYRLERRADQAYFGFAVGPHSWKKYLFPANLALWKAHRTESGFAIEDVDVDPPPRALVGVRSCELHAIAIQDRVFIGRDGEYTDPFYATARERLFLVAVECEHPGGTCFCASMGTGPAIEPGAQTDRVPSPVPENRPDRGRISLSLAPAPTSQNRRPFFDLALTELEDRFVVRSGSPAGSALMERLHLPPADHAECEEGRERVRIAAANMKRSVQADGLQGILHDNQEHPRWDDAASRCLSCTNCTLVCPTCFCSSVEEVSDLTGDHVERTRRWDSCFNPDFARVHGGDFRPSTRGRYRQWLTHKFASWFDQFDVSGCVGCGRCITWCPVGIDVTEELAALRASKQA